VNEEDKHARDLKAVVLVIALVVVGVAALVVLMYATTLNL
jgi:hypothetical protein